MRSLSQSFYSQLPETAETQHAKTVSELQSEVRSAALRNVISSLTELVSLGPQLQLTGDLLSRPGTRRRAGRRRAAVCTTNSLKLWRHDMLKRLQSCRVRYSHAHNLLGWWVQGAQDWGAW